MQNATRLVLIAGAAWGVASVTAPLAAPVAEPGGLGPYNVSILQGGVGMTRRLPEGEAVFRPGVAWTLSGWMRADAQMSCASPVITLSPPDGQGRLTLELRAGRLAVNATDARLEAAGAPATAGQWRAFAVAYEGGSLALFLDGKAQGRARTAAANLGNVLSLAPTDIAPACHFSGALADVRLEGRVAEAELQRRAASPLNAEGKTFIPVGVGWPVQERAWIGLTQPQDPWTLPSANTPPDPPKHAGRPTDGPNVRRVSSRTLDLPKWRLAFASEVTAAGAELSKPGFDDHSWRPATVPGTVLTTLIDQGVYPDPDKGLNNMAIPESLARRDYWYRTQFHAPKDLGGKHLELVFKGVNYAAEVFLNGERLGVVRGAFVRGRFDVTGRLRADQDNAISVRVSPPPHPGIPSEESKLFGPGENGGSMAIDGPTFVATEGWDWIPGVRDRNTGLWQGVELTATDAVRIGTPFVITHLSSPEHADLEIVAPVTNLSSSPLHAEIEAKVDGVAVTLSADLPPGASEIRFLPKNHAPLRIDHPKLWWPNGYGPADLHALEVTARVGGAQSDQVRTRFGIREITYELSLFDHAGRLRRVEVDPTRDPGAVLVDVRHEAIKQTPNGWAQSLTAAGEVSAGVKDVASATGMAPFLTLKVNGTPIAARGGSWGMDDSRKRVARDRLEPFFKLHRDANVNIIRNWLGQNTEDVFYDLADEYGLLILNDFWVSTQNFQIEPQDPALFLDNAQDVITRYRGHPSVALWFGRNEGVPPPILNEGLDRLVRELDGTRLYTGSSNRVNLQDSGPYNYRAPVGYFTDLAQGFSVEVGTPSLSTLEAIKASVPEKDRWPLSDTIAYHDWHFGGNGDVASFMKALAQQFGEATSLEDFERKAQMMNYVDYRAIFEGFAAHLWTQNSGRLLWMTHPSWPSNHWQMYSADYDTHASYYGVKSATEPLHAQMNLPDFALAVVNTTRADRKGLVLTARVTDLTGKALATRTLRFDALANRTTTLAALPLPEIFKGAPVVLVELELKDARAEVLSRNLYWQGARDEDLKALNGLPIGKLNVRSARADDGDVRVTLENAGTAPLLAAKLTLLDAAGARVLPAYYSDNYVSLLPGERRVVTIRTEVGAARADRIAVRGWNVAPDEIRIGDAR